MQNSNTPKSILVDCDVLSHFISNNCIELLPQILAPHSCYILDYVYKEINRHALRKAFVDKLIVDKTMILMPFPNDDMDIKKEFALIKSKFKLIGDGERACMAVAKHHKDIIASSNFRDIVPYCNQNKIHYLGTLDIIYLAYTRQIFTETECDNFIQTAIQSNNAKFPKGIIQIRFYEPKDLSFI